MTTIIKGFYVFHIDLITFEMDDVKYVPVFDTASTPASSASWPPVFPSSGSASTSRPLRPRDVFAPSLPREARQVRREHPWPEICISIVSLFTFGLLTCYLILSCNMCYSNKIANVINSIIRLIKIIPNLLIAIFIFTWFNFQPAKTYLS